MNNSNLIIGEDKIRLEIKPVVSKRRSLYVGLTFFLLLLFLIMGVALYNRATYGLGVVLGWKQILLIAMLIFGILYPLLRSLLWYYKGREVLVVRKNEIDYYRDMYLYKEGRKKNKYDDIEIILSRNIPDKKNTRESDENIMDDLILEEDEAILGFKLDGNKIISTYQAIPHSRIREMDAAIRVLRYKEKNKS